MSYTEFEQLMTNWPQYSWEPVEVTTSDGYILTLFHVWNEAEHNRRKGPVMFQHGHTMDATSWLSGMSYGHPPLLRIADLGHDLYFGNTRGTRYSSQHVSLDQVSDAEAYWNYTWADLSKDVLANVEAMYENAGGRRKGWYFGYSKGTVQMLIALMEDEDTVAQYLNRAVLMAPCTLTGTGTEPDLSESSMNEVGYFRNLGVYSYYGPTWEQDLQTICANSYQATCDYYTNQNVQAFSQKELDHYTQNIHAHKFQAYVEDWAYPDIYTFEGAEYDLTTISKVPISLIVAENDTVCTPVHADLLAQDISQTIQNHVTITGTAHGIFAWAVSDMFTYLISRELTTDTPGLNTETIADIWSAAPAGALGPQVALVAVALATVQMLVH